MKFFAFIMACTILTLSFMPCLDRASEVNSLKAKTELCKSDSQGDKDHDDDCSPFCHVLVAPGFQLIILLLLLATLK